MGIFDLGIFNPNFGSPWSEFFGFMKISHRYIDLLWINLSGFDSL